MRKLNFISRDIKIRLGYCYVLLITVVTFLDFVVISMAAPPAFLVAGLVLVLAFKGFYKGEKSSRYVLSFMYLLPTLFWFIFNALPVGNSPSNIIYLIVFTHIVIVMLLLFSPSITAYLQFKENINQNGSRES